MQERIIEIIVYLLEEFQQQHSNENYNDLSKQLISLGYTENEINLAFSWVFNHLQNKTNVGNDQFEYALDSNRVLHDVEKLVISSEAYGYLLQLRFLSLITDYDMETVIERALTIGTSTISIEDIKSIAATIIFGSDANGTWDGVFIHPGTNTIH